MLSDACSADACSAEERRKATVSCALLGFTTYAAYALLQLMDSHEAPRFWGADGGGGGGGGGPAASVSTSCALFRLHGCPVVVYANSQALYHWPDEEAPKPPTARK